MFDIYSVDMDTEDLQLAASLVSDGVEYVVFIGTDGTVPTVALY